MDVPVSLLPLPIHVEQDDNNEGRGVGIVAVTAVASGARFLRARCFVSDHAQHRVTGYGLRHI